MGLCFGQKIADLRISGDVDSTEALTSLTIASRLDHSICTEYGEKHGNVVRRCLECPFDIRDKSLDNEKFQEAVFDFVLTPLREDLESFYG